MSAKICEDTLIALADMINGDSSIDHMMEMFG
jgi:hypothetical protein